MQVLSAERIPGPTPSSTGSEKAARLHPKPAVPARKPIRQSFSCNYPPGYWYEQAFCANFASGLVCLPLTQNKSAPALPCEPLHANVPDLQGAGIAAVYYGQRQSGDFYDFFRVHPQRVLFGLFDAAGHVEQTRTAICTLQRVFRTVGTELFSRDEVNESEAMIELSLQLNRAVLEAEDKVRSCPAFVGCYNEGLGVVCYSNAGHTSALVRDANGVTELPAIGLPLGLFSHITSDASMVAIEPGAALLLVSRGIVEAEHNKEEFGLERVKQALQPAGAQSAKEICMTLMDKVRQFMETPPTHDDVTALALLRSNAP
jgi:serine phosphatase RsbU (regulator of sigma subunit)